MQRPGIGSGDRRARSVDDPSEFVETLLDGKAGVAELDNGSAGRATGGKDCAL
jgi:hypothetical protein